MVVDDCHDVVVRQSFHNVVDSDDGNDDSDDENTPHSSVLVVGDVVLWWKCNYSWYSSLHDVFDDDGCGECHYHDSYHFFCHSDSPSDSSSLVTTTVNCVQWVEHEYDHLFLRDDRPDDDSWMVPMMMMMTVDVDVLPVRRMMIASWLVGPSLLTVVVVDR